MVNSNSSCKFKFPQAIFLWSFLFCNLYGIPIKNWFYPLSVAKIPESQHTWHDKKTFLAHAYLIQTCEKYTVKSHWTKFKIQNLTMYELTSSINCYEIKKKTWARDNALSNLAKSFSSMVINFMLLKFMMICCFRRYWISEDKLYIFNLFFSF